jgi:hypothetical protein
MTTPFTGETVVVVGGGLSAAQAALMAIQKGAKRVVHVSRRLIHSRQYDLPFEWMDPRSAWGRAAKKGDKGIKFRIFEFFDTPKGERETWIRNARSGATVPECYLKRLEEAANIHHLERLVDEVATCEDVSAGATNAMRLTFIHGACPIVADRIVLATGSTFNVNAIPLLRNVTTQWDLPLIGTLPDLNEDLQWGDENFIVIGAFAMLEIGPDSGNLTGIRRAAAICADKLGAFESLKQEGGPLASAYGVLFEDNDSDSSDSTKSGSKSVDDDIKCEEKTLQFTMDMEVDSGCSTPGTCDADYYGTVTTLGEVGTGCAQCGTSNCENVAVASREVHDETSLEEVDKCVAFSKTDNAQTTLITGCSVGLTVGRAEERGAEIEEWRS